MQIMNSLSFVPDGQFGAYMQVSIQNDGPVTFEIESPPHLNIKDSRGRDKKENRSQISAVCESQDDIPIDKLEV